MRMLRTLRRIFVDVLNSLGISVGRTYMTDNPGDRIPHDLSWIEHKGH